MNGIKYLNNNLLNNSNNKTKMKSSFPKIFTVAVLLTIVVFVNIFWHIFDATRDLSTAQTWNFQINELENKIDYLEEVVTMSLQMAVVTGELKWKERYKNFKPQLEHSTKDISKLVSEFVRDTLTAQIKDSILKLDTLEDRIFYLVNKGKRNTAWSILSGKEYSEFKSIYFNAINQILSIARKELEGIINKERSRFLFANVSICIVIPILLYAWFTVRKYFNERNRVEKILKESEERYRFLFEEASDGFIIVDGETNEFISANRQMCEMTGYSLNEILKFGFKDIYPEEELKRIVDEFEKLIREKKELVHDIPVLRKDGTIIYTDVKTKKVVLHGKNCFFIAFRDNRERKGLEEEKVHVCKLETINNMIVTLNHEMNQPLTVITSCSGYLMKNISGKDSQFYEDVKMIHDEAWRLVALIKKVSKLKAVKTTDYSPGTKMIDLT